MDYNYNSVQAGTTKNGNVAINLNGDVGVRLDFPLDFDVDFFFGQRLTAFVGGR